MSQPSGRRSIARSPLFIALAVSAVLASVVGNVKPGTPGQDSDLDNTNAELGVTGIEDYTLVSASAMARASTV